MRKLESLGSITYHREREVLQIWSRAHTLISVLLGDEAVHTGPRLSLKNPAPISLMK